MYLTFCQISVDANGGVHVVRPSADPYNVEATTATVTIPTDTTNDVPQQPHAQVSLEQQQTLLNSDRPCDLR